MSTTENKNNIKNKKFFIIICGPTASGKTDFANSLAKNLKIKSAIVNADLGQFYTKLAIGTAKPDYKSEPVEHYLFDIIDEPEDFTVTQYRKLVLDCCQKLWKKNVLPILVGGSGFYLKSLYFPPRDLQVSDFNKEIKINKNIDLENKTNHELWDILNNIDESRAKKLHVNDRYRILRALDIFFQTGELASNYEPVLEPFGQSTFLFLSRDKQDLENRIRSRLFEMIKIGWIDEVKNLESNWHDFLIKKKIIGYDLILEYLKNNDLKNEKIDDLIENIFKKTKDYAKRQMTFFRSFYRILESVDKEKSFIKDIREINLTLLDTDLYIKQLSEDIFKIINS